MTVRLVKLKSLVWFAVVLLLALSFPLQVFANGPYPSLAPYALIGFLLAMPILATGQGQPAGRQRPRPSNIATMVRIYTFLVLLNTAWQTVAGVVSIYAGLSAMTVYLLPAVVFWYFRAVGSEAEIRAVLWAIVIAGFITGAYFVYDSFLKLALGQVSEYAQAAFQYSLDRTTVSAEEVNSARISLTARSFGLLESHSVSGAWIVLGAVAALALVPPQRRWIRRFVLILFGAMVLLGLNFTSIVAFVIIMAGVEFGGVAALAGRASASTWRHLASLGVVVLLVAAVVALLANETMRRFIVLNLSGQKDLALGTGTSNLSMAGLFVLNSKRYLDHVLSFPPALLVGDGFTTFGMARGGDIGLIESLAAFGIPFFLAALAGCCVLIMAGFRWILNPHSMSGRVPNACDRGAILQFAVSVILLILVTEGHYAVWSAKSVLPIIFFAFALFERYLPRRA